MQIKPKKTLILLLCLLLVGLWARPAAATSVIAQNLSQDGNYDATYNGYDEAKGQSFTGNGATLDSVVFKLSKVGSPTGNCYARLYAHSGTFGSTSIPTGSALASSNALDVATISASATDYTFTFATPYTPANGTNYVVTFEFTGGDSNNALLQYYNYADICAGNLSYTSNLSTWSYVGAFDLYFICQSNQAGAPTHTYDTKTASTRSNGAPKTFSHTCASGSSLLVVSLVVDGSTDRAGGAPTYNNVALTQADANRKAASSPETVVELWYLLNPPTGSAYTISIPNTGSAKYITAEAASFKADAGYTTVLRAATYATSTSTNPTGPTHTGLAVGDVIVAVVGDGATTWNPSARTGTQLYDMDDGAYGDGAQYLIKTDTANQALAWTQGSNEDWAIVSAVFKLQISGGQTYEGALPLAGSSGLTPGGLGDFLKSLALPGTSGFSPAGIGSLVNSAGLSGTGVFSAGGVGSFFKGQTIEGLAAYDAAGQGDFPHSLSMSAGGNYQGNGWLSGQAALSLTAMTSWGAAVLQAAANELGLAGDAAFSLAQTAEIYLGLVLNGAGHYLVGAGSIVNGSLTLAAAGDYQGAAQLLASGIVSFTSQAACSLTSWAAEAASLALEAWSDYATNLGNAAYSLALNLTGSGNFTLLPQLQTWGAAIYAGGGSYLVQSQGGLVAAAALSAAGNFLSGTRAILKAEISFAAQGVLNWLESVYSALFKRAYWQAPFENRLLNYLSERRFGALLAENRLVSPGYELRPVLLGAENRRLIFSR